MFGQLSLNLSLTRLDDEVDVVKEFEGRGWGNRALTLVKVGVLWNRWGVGLCQKNEVLNRYLAAPLGLEEVV